MLDVRRHTPRGSRLGSELHQTLGWTWPGQMGYASASGVGQAVKRVTAGNPELDKALQRVEQKPTHVQCSSAPLLTVRSADRRIPGQPANRCSPPPRLGGGHFLRSQPRPALPYNARHSRNPIPGGAYR
jgi:hypothetical protein